MSKQVTHRHRCPCGAEFEVRAPVKMRGYVHKSMSTLLQAHQAQCAAFLENAVLLSPDDDTA